MAKSRDQGDVLSTISTECSCCQGCEWKPHQRFMVMGRIPVLVLLRARSFDRKAAQLGEFS